MAGRMYVSLNLTPRTDSFDEFEGLPLCRGVVDTADSGSFLPLKTLRAVPGKSNVMGSSYS
jgi:hypothetical protein